MDRPIFSMVHFSRSSAASRLLTLLYHPSDSSILDVLGGALLNAHGGSLLNAH